MITLRKTATLVEDYEHICDCDEALDSETEEFGEHYRQYLATGDTAHLAAISRTGLKPCVWRLRHIRGRAKWALQDLARRAGADGLSIEALGQAAQIAIRGVEGLVDERGKEIRLEWETDEDVGQIVAERWLAMLPDSVLISIGLRAITMMVTPPD